MDADVNRAWERPTASWVGITLLFVVSFCVPMFFGMVSLGVFDRRAPVTETINRFPGAVEVSSQGTFLSINHSEYLLPNDGKDFLFAVWINLRRLPASGQRLLLLSKYEAGANTAPQRGYALALRRDGDSIRPVLFWGDTQRGGRWYEFPEAPIEAKQWGMIAFGIHDQRYLGAYFRGAGEDDEVQVLGGYDVGAGSGMGMGEADLVIGAARDRPFRGLIGPILLASKHGLSNHLAETLSSFSSSSSEVPAGLSPKDIGLWIADGANDLSLNKAPVDLVRDRS